MKFIRFSSVALFALLAAGCPELGTQPRTITSEIPESPTWTDVKPILDEFCNECHSVPLVAVPPSVVAPDTLRLDVCEDVAGVTGAKSNAVLRRNMSPEKIHERFTCERISEPVPGTVLVFLGP